MYKIGITGGIGSGKSTVSSIFEQLGVPVYYADPRAKALMNTDPQLKAFLQAVFGEDIFYEGQLNRKKMAGFVFAQPALLEQVNQKVHPAVAADFERWCDSQTAPYVIEESAILFECGMESRFDRIIVVTAPENERIQRVQLRDGLDETAIRARMANQWHDTQKIAKANFVIDNSDKRMLLPQVLAIHRKLMSIVGA